MALGARTALLSLLTGGGVRPLDVERRLRERPPRRYRRALAAAVGMVRDGVHSVLEEVFAVQVEQAHGLPPARRQSPFVVDGVTLWEDATYDHLGIPLTVRLDGRTHLRNDVSFRDRRRDNAAELAGRSRLTFGWTDLSADPCGGAEEVELVLRRHGWDGQISSCPRCVGRRSFALDRWSRVVSGYRCQGDDIRAQVFYSSRTGSTGSLGMEQAVVREPPDRVTACRHSWRRCVMTVLDHPRTPRTDAGSASVRGRRRVAADAAVVAGHGTGLAAAVADGIGDSTAAASAARTAAAAAVRTAPLSGTTAAVAAARDAVLAVPGAGDAVLVVAAGLPGGGWEVSWVGDARALLWDGHALLPLTRDHTLAEELRIAGVDAGGAWANVVTTTVATADPATVGHVRGPVGGGTLVLLSDGVHRTLDPSAIVAELSVPRGSSATARALVEAALAAGTRDNATAAVVPLPREWTVDPGGAMTVRIPEQRA